MEPWGTPHSVMDLSDIYSVCGLIRQDLDFDFMFDSRHESRDPEQQHI